MSINQFSPISLCGSFTKSFPFNLPCNFKEAFYLKPSQYFRKSFSRSFSALRLACYAVGESFDPKNEGSLKGMEFLHLMDERGICPNSQTYLWLFDFCLNSGNFLDCKKLHGRILKAGFYRESVICDKLIDFYLAVNDLISVVKVFDDMPIRGVITWNKILSSLVSKKMNNRVLGLFMQMVEENFDPSEVTYASVLRACGGVNAAFQNVEQIHARIIRHGFAAYPIVCNPLIDIYAKNGFIYSARKVFDELCVVDIVSWVAMISGYSQNGYGEEAIRLFCEMHMSGIFPTPYVFSSVLSACTKTELFDIGEQLHALVFKCGFVLETYVCNALVTLYSRTGNFISAEQVFSKIQSKDEVSYNSLISGLAQQGYSDRALELFKKMQLNYLKPGCVTIASLLSACASIKALSKGEQLHSYVIKAGMSLDIIIEGSLLDFYVKCSDISIAHRFFLTTQKENVVLWNVMLVAFGQLDNLYESFWIFRQMQIEGLSPNQFTYPSILRTCTSFGVLDLGEQIHSLVIKAGFQFNVYVCSVLIDMYAKNGNLDVAHGILRRLPEKDVVSWTALISGYTQHGLFADALVLFEEMLNQGIQSDNIGFSSAISACAGIHALNQGRQIHAQTFISGYSQDLSVNNALVTLYARCGRIHEAYVAFENTDVKDSITWNGLISGFAQSGYCEEALKIFAQMQRSNIESSLFTFGSAVSAAANIANIKQGRQIHAMIIKTGFDSEIEVSNALTTLYAKCGCLDDAEQEFFEMTEKNEISWNAMITGYSQHGCGIEAVNLFEKMKLVGPMPNHVTFVGVLSACSHVGLVDEGLSYFESMNKEHALVPLPEHYACVVDLLSRAGLLSQAKKFIEEMPFKPDAMVWRTLLSSCIVRKNTEVGEVAARQLLKLEPEDSATYVLVSNMYAVARKWDYRDHTRQMMKDRGVKKEPGRSWIEVKNSIHAFFVGDKLHSLADQIYKFLTDLNKQAAKIGYVQDRYSLLNDLEQEHKDPTEYIHSEKLAIAFGLLSLSEPIPIRVMKNLRVCNDCHTWIKFVSKISNRKIVVRDAYRFHHFEGGLCSCKDYCQLSPRLKLATVADIIIGVKLVSVEITGSILFQSAIVTGGSRGIGRAIVTHLHSLGANVVINYASNSIQADQLAMELNTSASSSHPRAFAIKANISNPDEVKQLFERAEQDFGSKIHILINCAGVLDPKYPTLANTTVEDFDTAFNVNTKVAFLACREAANRLPRGGSGRIISISTSVVGANLPGYAAYAASKAAVETMIKILAKELKGTGITANCVAPGPVATELFFAGKTEEMIKRLVDACPLDRLGKPKDISEVVGFLASDAGEWINGQVIRVNGGFVI